MKNRIKEILTDKGMSAKDLSNLVNISVVSISNIINDKQEASANTLKKIADKLDIPFWELFVSKEEIVGSSGDCATGVCPHCGKPIHIRLDK